MTPERWNQVKELFHQALGLDESRRAAFLAQACSGDEYLRREVELLISGHNQAGSFIGAPPEQCAAEVMAQRQDSLMLGQVIGHYQIAAHLGSGGMGEVYLAEDIALERKVAIKLLPVASVEDEGARKRLFREARAAGTLDHPNICPVYEVGDQGDRAFIAMQYVEGETLHSRIKTNPPSLQQAIDIAARVADALVEAHSHGIVHRDIKPQNIMLTDRGRVKVLDFGIAKIVEPVGDARGEIPSQLTTVGTVVGTVPYMSPEQIKGEPVDGRSDIFSLGAVLYECVTGKLPFTGSSAMEICAEIIHSEPRPAAELNAGISPELERILTKALAKSTADRYQSAAEMLADLRRLSEAPPRASEASTRLFAFGDTVRIWPSGFLRRRAAALAILAISVVAIAAIWVAPRLWRAAPHRPSAEARRFYEMGTDYISNRSYYQASKALERAVALDGKYALAHARLAEAYSEIDQTEKAKDELLLASSLVPDRSALPPADAMYLDAIAASVRREFALAIELYRKIAEQASDSDKAEVNLDLGRAYDKNDSTDKAIESYLEVARLDSQSAAAFLQLGILYGRKQNLQSADQEFDKALAIYQDISNEEGVTEVFLQRGLLLAKIGKLADARAQLEKALDKARSNDNKYQEIKTLLELSKVSYSQGKGQTAVALASQATEAAQRNNTRSLATDGLIDLGNAYNFRGEHQEAEKYFKQALEFARGDKARRSEARALLALGGLSVIQDDPDQATSYLEEALAFYQPAGYRRETSLALSYLGRAKRQNGDYDAALQTFEQQLQVAGELGDPSQIAFSHTNIGILLGFDLERYPEALGHLDESLNANRSLGARSAAGNDLMNRGRLLWQLGRYDQAKKSLDEAFSIASDPDSGSKQLLAWTHLGRAQTALSEERYAEARLQSQQALESGAKQSREITIQAKYTLGLVQARSGAAQAGNRLCEEAIALAVGRTNPRLLSHALLSLAEARLGLRDAPGALKHALQAEERFARWGQQESEWRAWLVAARASKMARDDRAANEYAGRASAALSTLRQKWDTETYKSYSARPDIRAAARQLDDLAPRT